MTNVALLGPAPSSGDVGLLSVVIKTYNEEDKIGRAIESVLALADEVSPLRLEVVVADSCSEDATVVVASRYPVRVVRLRNPSDRGCGAGVQLGYEWAHGEWVYLMDGDMRLQPGFLCAALQRLAQDAALGGVGGGVADDRVINGIDRIRVNNRSGQLGGELPWLEGGGLYRRSAIGRAGGYAADRNLQAYEEAELGLRVRHAGFRLLRLDRVAVSHQGHAMSTWALMRRHWRSRRAMSAGMLLRMALPMPWRGAVVRMLAHPLATGGWWLALMVGCLLPGLAVSTWLAVWLSLSGLAVLALALHKRDAAHALVSVASWHYALAAIVIGWSARLQPPGTPIEAELLQDYTAPPVSGAL